MAYSKIENTYESPFVEVQIIDVEGVLCASHGNESVGEETGNGGFI